MKETKDGLEGRYYFRQLVLGWWTDQI